MTVPPIFSFDPRAQRRSRFPLSCRWSFQLPEQKRPHACRLLGFSQWASTREHLSLCETRVRETHHALETDSVKVLGPVVPEDVGGAVRTRCTPVLDLRHLMNTGGKDKMVSHVHICLHNIPSPRSPGAKYWHPCLPLLLHAVCCHCPGFVFTSHYGRPCHYILIYKTIIVRPSFDLAAGNE